MDSDSSGADIVELGSERRFGLPEWRPSRGAGLFAAAALVIGLAAGYTAGDRHASSTAALRKSTATTSSGTSPSSATGAAFALTDSPALTQDTGACSVQTGQELQLGVQVTNQSTATITLQTAKAVLPLGELKQVTWQWATWGSPRRPQPGARRPFAGAEHLAVGHVRAPDPLPGPGAGPVHGRLPRAGQARHRQPARLR